MYIKRKNLHPFCCESGDKAADLPKKETMLYDKMERFLTLLSKDGEKPWSKKDYRLICRHLHVAPADLDEILEEELGVTGEELLREPSNFIKFADYLGNYN